MLITAEFSIQHVIMTILPQAILLKLKKHSCMAFFHKTVPQLLHEFRFEIQVNFDLSVHTFMPSLL